MIVMGIIPARYASTRFPGKPLAMLNGRPMIQHVYDRAVRSTLLTDVIVATDDQRIYDIIKEFGGEAIMTSPNHATGTDRIAEVAAKMTGVDIIVNIQGDEPLIDPASIDAAIQPMLIEPMIPMVSLMAALNDPKRAADPNVVKVVVDNDNFALYFSRSPIPYLRDGAISASQWKKHIGLYAFRRNFLLKYAAMQPTNLEQIEKLEQLRALENGYKIKMVEVEDHSIGVDTPEDFEMVRKILSGGSF